MSPSQVPSDLGLFPRCHSVHGSSVVDYLLLGKNDVNCFSHFNVGEPNEFSDHSYLEISIKSIKRNKPNIHNETYNPSIKWDNQKINEFKNTVAMKADDFLFLEVSLQSENCDVNFISKKLTDILYDCSQTVFGLNAKKQKCDHRPQNKKLWFNQTCHEARRKFNLARNRFLRNTSDDNLRNAYLEAKKYYNTTKRSAKKNFNSKQKKIL